MEAFRFVRLVAITLPTPKATAVRAFAAFLASAGVLAAAVSASRLGVNEVTGSLPGVVLLADVAVFFFPMVQIASRTAGV